ncbi:alpha/beta fold hydrolase [Deinococcus pimensis]|uniref:alpha/beta fold hydrolase n=1 Tax=Deinococcus pimensis TaxID=309888 RepID=UPI000482A630|nr:alpha/beta hydrolase [Deinococcus pimensis]
MNHRALALTALTAAAHTHAATPPSTEYLVTPQGRLAYDDTHGDGPLVLAIPGMGDLRGQYRLLAPALHAAGYRVVTMDVRGHGDTDATWDDYGAHAVGRDALALIDHLGASRAVILGNSFAAGSALWAAHDRPERVAGLVLIGPVTRDLPSPWYMRPAMKLLFGGPWNLAFWMTYRKSLFPARQAADHAAYEARVRANLAEPGRMHALKAMIFASKADTEPLVSEVHAPTLVVMGTKDPDFPDASAEGRWVSERTHGELMLVEGSGHYPHVEEPDLVTPRVLTFLRGLR